MRRHNMGLTIGLMVMGLVLLPPSAESQRGMRWMMDRGDGPYVWYCPYCGRHLGPGMMRYRGGLCMGPGPMDYRGGMCMSPGYSFYGLPAESVDKEKAKDLVDDYLRYGRNPNLKIGDAEDKGSDFEVSVVTKDGSLVDRILVNKNNGWMRSVY